MKKYIVIVTVLFISFLQSSCEKEDYYGDLKINFEQPSSFTSVYVYDINNQSVTIEELQIENGKASCALNSGSYFICIDDRYGAQQGFQIISGKTTTLHLTSGGILIRD
ncbi:hypothetical protein [Labilibaculum euxinus]